MKKDQLRKILVLSLLIILPGLKAGFLFAQKENLNVLDRWTEWSDGKNMLIHHLNDNAFNYLHKRDKIIASLGTKEDWIKRQEDVKRILMKITGPFPAKTPLNAKIIGVIKKDGYRIEKIVFESMPSFYVTGCLFIPEGTKGKKPAILNVIGHTDISFRGDIYQTMILHLVQKGFIVFAVDPVGQGERFQYFDSINQVPMFGPGTAEHSYFGNQCFLSGVSPARYFIWDGIRAIDYLVSRKEVDPDRIGVTGLSGGGTQTALISAFDERVKASAPSCYITGFKRLLESVGAQDAEQNLYHEIMEGITHADLIEVRAPKPTLIVSTTRDFFSIQGARESYNEALNAFKAFGNDNDLLMTEDDFEHGFTSKNNEATCAFFQKYLGMPGNPSSSNIRTIPKEDLKITPTGQISTSYNGETVFSINARESSELIGKLEISRTETDRHLIKVKKEAAALAGYDEQKAQDGSVFRGAYQRDGYRIEMYSLIGNGNYVIPVLMFVPDQAGKKPAVVYLNPAGKAKDAESGGQIEQIVKKGYVVVAPDILGFGETAPEESFYNASFFVSVLTGKTLVGTGSEDIRTVTGFLCSRPDVDKEKITGMAMGKLAVVMLHSAVFSGSFSSLILVDMPLSYRLFATNRFYERSFAPYFVPGALTRYDLPDLIACLTPARVILAGSKDQMGNPSGSELIESELIFPMKIYEAGSKPTNLVIRKESDNLASLLE
jgi:dienelactone hydrolase